MSKEIWPLISVAVIVALILIPKRSRVQLLVHHVEEPVAIVAVMTDPQPWQVGLAYFDEKDWPVPGYTLIKRVTGASAAELRTLHRRST